jgi:hypothetical protein
MTHGDITTRLRAGPVTPALAAEAADQIEDLRAVILALLNPPRQALTYTLPVPKHIEEQAKFWDWYLSGNMQTGEIVLRAKRHG